MGQPENSGKCLCICQAGGLLGTYFRYSGCWGTGGGHRNGLREDLRASRLGKEKAGEWWTDEGGRRSQKPRRGLASSSGRQKVEEELAS